MRGLPTRAAWLVLPLLVAVASCEVSSHGPRDDKKVVGTPEMMPAGQADSIARLVRDATTAAFASGAAAATAIPATYAQDAVLSDGMNQTHAGHAAIARVYAQGMPPGASIDIRSSGAIGSGDLVVDMGTYTVRIPNPTGGATEIPGRYLIAIQRMDDDSWKIVRQIENPIGPAPSPSSAPAPADSAAAATGPASSGFDVRQ